MFLSDEKGLTRREFLIGAGAAAASLPFMNIGSALGAQKRPNFVFILTDDQRYDAMSCAGHPFLYTPNMDRIAKEGARFTNAFVTTSLCSPSRASFLTGRYAHSHGVRDNSTPFDDGIPTFPRLLQEAGYDTAFIGKWHMGSQEGPRPGFNRWVSFKGQGDYYNPTLNIDGETGQVAGYITDLLTKHAVDWLRQPRESPLCLYLSHKAVHQPWSPAVRHSKLFADTPIPRAKSFYDTLEGKPKWVRELGLGPPDVANYEEFARNYCRTLVAVDEGVGRVLSTLESLGVLDNTVVVFAGDNGYLHREHSGMGDKRVMYEESIRIPLVMRYPKLVRSGTLVDRMVLNIDMCPTFLDIAGVRAADGVQGRSMVPLLRGRSAGWREDFLYAYDFEPPYKKKPANRGVRTDRWKYTEYPELDDICELYDLKNDPFEMHNLGQDPKHAGVLADMRARFERLVKETGYKPREVPSIPAG